MSAAPLLWVMKHYTHLIWDFNGTVLNDMQAGIDSINEMLRARDLPLVQGLEAYRQIFDFPVEQYYRSLGFDFEKEDYKTCLAPTWVELYLKSSKTSALYPGVKPLSAALRAMGIRQSILSASEREMLMSQLSERGATDWFDEIWGTDSIHAYGKSQLACAWRDAHMQDRVLLLGDTTHDSVVAASIGADCILVADGHQSRERLLACGVPVVDDLSKCAQRLHEMGVI